MESVLGINYNITIFKFKSDNFRRIYYRGSTGYPMLVRSIDSSFNLANIMKTHIYSAFSTLKIGIDLLKRMKILKLIQYMDTEVYSKPKSCSNIFGSSNAKSR